MIARDRSIYGNDFDGRSAVVVGRMLRRRLSMVEFVGSEIRRAKVLASRFVIWIFGETNFRYFICDSRVQLQRNQCSMCKHMHRTSDWKSMAVLFGVNCHATALQ